MAGLPVHVKLGILLVSMATVKSEWNDEYEITNYYMSDLCGTTVNMVDNFLNEAVIQLSRNDNYVNNMDCDLTIVTSEGRQLLFNILYVKLDSCDDWFQLYSETTNSSHALSSRLCAPYNVLTTPQKTGILKFNSNSVGNQGNFKILVTSFYTTGNGECNDSHFNCGIHGRCIKFALTCNDRDNCGNEADEYNCEQDKGHWWIYSIVFSVAPIVFVASVAVIISCILLHKKKKGMVGPPRPGQTRTPGDPPPAYNLGYNIAASTGTGNTPNQTWFPPSATNTAFSATGATVDPPPPAFSYNQQTYSTEQEQRL